MSLKKTFIIKEDWAVGGQGFQAPAKDTLGGQEYSSSALPGVKKPKTGEIKYPPIQLDQNELITVLRALANEFNENPRPHIENLFNKIGEQVGQQVDINDFIGQ